MGLIPNSHKIHYITESNKVAFKTVTESNKYHVAHLRILVREVAVLAGTQRSRLRRLKELPVAAVDREGERALGELDARLVKHQSVGARLVDDLER